MVKAELKPRPWRFYFSGQSGEHPCGVHTYYDPEHQWLGVTPDGLPPREDEDAKAESAEV